MGNMSTNTTKVEEIWEFTSILLYVIEKYHEITHCLGVSRPQFNGHVHL